MKRLLAFLLMAGTLGATTRVLDTIYDASGKRANGLLFIEWPAFVTPAGKSVAGSMRTVRVSNGVVDIQLDPTLGGTPATAVYSVRYALSGTSGLLYEQWSVPDTTSAVNLAGVRVAASGGGVVSTSGPGTITPVLVAPAPTSYAGTVTVAAGYNAGRAAWTQGSSLVTGTGTSWSSSMVGSYLLIGGSAYQISVVPSATQLTLVVAVTEATDYGPYTICTPLVVPGATHGFTSASINAAFFRDDPAQAVRVVPAALWVDRTNFNVTALFPAGLTGRVLIHK